MHHHSKTDRKCSKLQTEQQQGAIRRKISTQGLQVGGAMTRCIWQYVKLVCVLQKNDKKNKKKCLTAFE